MSVWIEAGLGLVILAIVGTAAWAGWKAAPFFPTAGRDVNRLLDVAGVTAEDTVIDLGCGDGRMLFAAAARGARAIGYEISLVPYLVAKGRWFFSPVRSRVQVRLKSFWLADLSSATVLVAFLLPRSMSEVARRLAPGLRPGTKIVSYAFPIAEWEPIRRDKPDPTRLPIWVYATPVTGASAAPSAH